MNTMNTTPQASAFPVALLNLTDAKTWQAGQENVFSLHKYNRVRVESYPLKSDELETIEFSQNEARKMLAWLEELDTCGLLQAEPVSFPTNQYGDIYPSFSYEVTKKNEVELWHDRSLILYSREFYVYGHSNCARLRQADMLQFLTWLRTHVGSSDD